MSGMVVQAGSGARQFHVTRSTKLDRQVDFVVWVSVDIAQCKNCGGSAYEVIGGAPNWFYREWRLRARGDEMIACPSCHGKLIE